MFQALIQKRRSIRRYLEKPIEPEKIDLLVETALRSPSSMGSNPWEFVFVTDRDLLGKLAKAKPHGSSFLRYAALGIVICADPKKSDVWTEDASIASIYLQLAAEDLGLGSCWIQIRNRMHDEAATAEAYIAELLKIPSGMAVESIIAVGYPERQKPPHPRDALELEKVYLNTYGRSYSSSRA